MHKQDAIYLDQLCPKISNKTWRESLYKFTKYKCIYCGKPWESLDHIHQCQKVAQALRVIAYHVVWNAMVKNQILKFLVGTEVKIFMILEGLWQ